MLTQPVSRILLTAMAIATLGLSACKKDEGKAAPAKPAEPVADVAPKTADPAPTPAPAPAPAPEVKVFTSADGGYSIAFPSAPSEQTHTEPTALGPLDIHIASVDGGDKAWLVSWQEQPAKAPKDPKVILDGQRDGMVGGMPGSKVLEQKDITLGTNPGRSMVIKLATPDATQFTRVYVIGNRMYQLAMLGTGAGDPAVANAFLDSFTLTAK